ncbi:protein kilB [Streptomyces olivaceoviridis]
MEIAAAVVAVVGTVLGAGVVGVQQYYAARLQRRQTLRDRALTALSELSTALADHRRAMWVREDLRLSGAAPADAAAAREASHVTRSAITAPQIALTVLLPQLRPDVNAAVRAAYDMRGAASTEVLAARRESAISAADGLAASAAYLLSRP